MEHQEEKEKYTLADFRKEIEGVSKNSANEGDFPVEINSDELTENDKLIWMKYKDATLSKEDIFEFKKKFEEENGFESKTRYNFLMYVFNRYNVMLSKKELGL